MLDALKLVIRKYRSKRDFFRLVGQHFGYHTPEFRLINKAYDLARKQFFKVRRQDGDSYFYHKVAVAVIILKVIKITDDANLIAAALLHDLLEDIPGWTREKLALYLRNEDVAFLVEAVTKPDRLAFRGNVHKYEKAVFAKVRSGGYRAIKLKLADRLHNMITLWGSTEKKLQKTLETLRYVLPLAVEIDVLWPELTIACGHELNKKPGSEPSS